MFYGFFVSLLFGDIENGRNKDKRSKGNSHRDDKDKSSELANVPGNIENFH